MINGPTCSVMFGDVPIVRLCSVISPVFTVFLTMALTVWKFSVFLFLSDYQIFVWHLFLLKRSCSVRRGFCFLILSFLTNRTSFHLTNTSQKPTVCDIRTQSPNINFRNSEIRHTNTKIEQWRTFSFDSRSRGMKTFRKVNLNLKAWN